jgi:hypothetical protein
LQYLVSGLEYSRGLKRIDVVSIADDYVQRHQALQKLPCIRIIFQRSCINMRCRVWGYQEENGLYISAHTPDGRVANSIDQITTLFHELRHLEQDVTGKHPRLPGRNETDSREADADEVSLKELARWMKGQYRRQASTVCHLPPELEEL